VLRNANAVCGTETQGIGGWMRSRKEILEELDGAVERAVDKTLSHRGISTSIALGVLSDLLIELGDMSVIADFEAAPYAMYGAPKVAVVAAAYGVALPDRKDWERMARGEPCSSYCEQGCE
jgi:hypothetical protein